jgi:two-component system LytT family sensor kinase
LFIIAVSIAFKMFSDQIKNETKAKERETENLKTELSFLRSQVSPHFMFNVLNNMVALVRKHFDQLEPSLIKLSSLLRYMLYETNEQSVALEKEVEYLQSYIDLQQQRFGKNVQLYVDLKEIDNNYFIEPMLLIPFVENAYKHGIGMVEDAEIKIVLKVKNGLLQFDVKNKFSEIGQTHDQTTGIGLNNVKRRLNLLYKDSHNLVINKNDNWFLASLQINIR